MLTCADSAPSVMAADSWSRNVSAATLPSRTIELSVSSARTCWSRNVTYSYVMKATQASTSAAVVVDMLMSVSLALIERDFIEDERRSLCTSRAERRKGGHTGRGRPHDRPAPWQRQERNARYRNLRF